MTKLQELVQRTSELTPEERAELLSMLLAQSHCDMTVEEAAAGQRGLAAWTESVAQDDWSALYPESLRNGKGQSA